MHRIISPDNTPTKPASPVGTQGYATADGPGTIIPPEWHNSVQDEIITALSLRGITPDPADDTQLAQLLAPSVQVIEGNNEATPAETTTTLQRAVVASYLCVAGAPSGDLRCFVAASEKCGALTSDTAVVASAYVAVNGHGCFAAACLVDGPDRAEIIGGLAAGSVALGLRQVTAGAKITGSYCAGIASQDVWLEDDRCAAVAALDATVDANESAVVASRYAQIGPDFNSKDCAIVASSGVSAAARLKIGAAADYATACAAMGVHDGAGPASHISGTANVALASASVDIQGSNAAARSAVIATGGATIAGAENAAIATNNAFVDADRSAIVGGSSNVIDGATDSTILGGDNNTVRKANSHAIGCEETSIPSASPRSRVVALASRFVDSSLGGATSDYQVIGGVNGSPLGPKWRLDSTLGKLFYTSSSGPGADYAEWFPNADGSPHPVGRLVARRGAAVTLGQPGLRALSVVSANPAVTGNDDSMGWAHRFAHGPMGEPLYDDLELEGGRVVRVQRVNPEYDPSLAPTHVPRSERPSEWTRVGLTGQLLLAVEADVAADDFICCGVDGLGRRSDVETRIEVMELVEPFDASRGYAIARVLRS